MDCHTLDLEFRNISVAFLHLSSIYGIQIQDSFYRGLTAEESEHVHEYNFDHPGILFLF